MEILECEILECLANQYGRCECSSRKNGSCTKCQVTGGNAEEPEENG